MDNLTIEVFPDDAETPTVVQATNNAEIYVYGGGRLYILEIDIADGAVRARWGDDPGTDGTPGPLTS